MHKLAVFLLLVVTSSEYAKFDSVTPMEIMKNGGVYVNECQDQAGTMSVDKIRFNRFSRAVHVKGLLESKLTGGHIIAKIDLGEAPKGATRWQKAKRHMAWSWWKSGQNAHLGKANQTQPFCSQQRPCPIERGYRELRFGLTSLPKLVLAGAYKMHIKAYDQMGKLLVCLEGGLTVETGKDGEVIRKLDTCMPAPSHDCGLDLCGSCASSSDGHDVPATSNTRADKALGILIGWLCMVTMSSLL